MSIDQEPARTNETVEAFQREEAAIKETYPQGLLSVISEAVSEAFQRAPVIDEKAMNMTIRLVYKTLEKFRKFVELRRKGDRMKYIETLHASLLKTAEDDSIESDTFDLKSGLPSEVQGQELGPMEQIYKDISSRLYRSKNFREYLESLVNLEETGGNGV